MRKGCTSTGESSPIYLDSSSDYFPINSVATGAGMRDYYTSVWPESKH